MPRHKREQAFRVAAPSTPEDARVVSDEAVDTLELREERLVAHKDLREIGEIEVRTEVDEIPGQLEVEAYREEVTIEHEPVGEMVSEREEPWEENGVLIVPIYEEQVVVSKRLILRERMHIRRVATTERRLFQDTLRRERLVVEDPSGTGLVHEVYPTDEPRETPAADTEQDSHETSGFFGSIVRKALE